MQQTLTLSMIRTLRGVPLAVLLVCVMSQKPVTAEFIERNSGYTDKPVRQALALLNDMGLVSHTRTGWQICTGAVQLPLITDELPEEAPVEPDNVIDCESKSDTICQGRKLSESETFRPALDRSRSSLINLDKDLKQDLELDLETSENLRVEENLKACDAAGIREPQRTRLSKMAHVTPELIRYHIQTTNYAGWAISRIERNFPIKKNCCPETRQNFDNFDEPDEAPGVELEAVQIPKRSESDDEAMARAIETAKTKLGDNGFYLIGLRPGRVEAGRVIFRAMNKVSAEWVNQNALGILESLVDKKVFLEVGW
jgi:hypothetical protein